MGTIVHHAIVVTGWGSDISRSHAKALNIFNELDLVNGACMVSPLLASVTNGYQSFLVGPDGSKEGWEASDMGEEARAEFIEWLRTSNVLVDWALIRYGGDDDDVACIDAHGGKTSC